MRDHRLGANDGLLGSPLDDCGGMKIALRLEMPVFGDITRISNCPIESLFIKERQLDGTQVLDTSPGYQQPLRPPQKSPLPEAGFLFMAI